MNKLFPTALGLKVAIAISAGGVLVQHPLHTDSAPRAYGDITIAESDNQKVLPADKAGTAPHKPLRRLVHRPPTLRLLLKLRPARKAKARRRATLAVTKRALVTRARLLLRSTTRPRELVGETGGFGTPMKNARILTVPQKRSPGGDRG